MQIDQLITKLFASLYVAFFMAHPVYRIPCIFNCLLQLTSVKQERSCVSANIAGKWPQWLTSRIQEGFAPKHAAKSIQWHFLVKLVENSKVKLFLENST